jgi:inner membrane protein involved in colicin E2 resistance
MTTFFYLILVGFSDAVTFSFGWLIVSILFSISIRYAYNN